MIRVQITHQRSMSPHFGPISTDGPEGATIVTDLVFDGYHDQVSTKMPNGWLEKRDDESRVHAENVFKLMDRLATRHHEAMKILGWVRELG